MATKKTTGKKRIQPKVEEPEVDAVETEDDDDADPTFMDSSGQLVVDDPNAEVEDEEDEDDDEVADEEPPDPNAIDQAPEGTPGFVQQNYPGMPKDGIVLAPDDQVYVEADLIDGKLHLTKPVYRAVKPYRSNRLVFNQVYAIGQVIPAKDAVKL